MKYERRKGSRAAAPHEDDGKGTRGGKLSLRKPREKAPVDECRGKVLVGERRCEKVPVGTPCCEKVSVGTCRGKDDFTAGVRRGAGRTSRARKLVLLTLALFLLGALGCGQGPTSYVPDEPEPETPDIVHEASIVAPDSLRYGERAAVSARCTCGAPLTLVCLDDNAEVLDGNLLPLAAGATELAAFHADFTHLATRTVRIERGCYAGISHPPMTVRWGETADFGEGFALAEGETLPDTVGTFSLRLSYCADPARYEPFALEVTLIVTPGASLTPPEVAALEAVYAPGLTLGALELPAGFSWQEPDTPLHAGSAAYAALYAPSPCHEPALTEVDIFVAKAEPSEEQLVPPVLAAVEYEETRTLAAMMLPTGWSWTKPDTVPTVAVPAYPARCQPGADYLPRDTVIPLTVTPKRAPMPALDLPPVCYAERREALLPDGAAERGFYFRETAPLPVGTHAVLLCWRPNENYAEQTREATLEVRRNETFFEDLQVDVRRLFLETGSEGVTIRAQGLPYAVEFSLDGAAWSADSLLLPEGTAVVLLRFAGCENYAPSTVQRYVLA